MQKASVQRCSLGVDGLDQITHGGVPRNRLYLVQGNPGVGKTTLALSFLLAGVKAGEKGLYITLSETKDELEQVARSHGWSLDGLEIMELSTIEKHLQTLAPDTLFHPSEIELNRTTEFLIRHIEKVKPARLVLDSLAELRLMSETALRYRRQMLSLKQFFSGFQLTVLLLDDLTEQRDLQVQSIAHGVISMELLSLDYGIDRRRVRISKIRGIPFCGGYHDYIIREGGIDVFPRLVAADYEGEFERRQFPSGIPEMDLLMDGGLDAGTSTLVIGPAGTGKSSIASQFASEAARTGGKALLITFDESTATLMHRGNALGMKLSEYRSAGRIVVRQVDPVSKTPGQLAHYIKECVVNDGVNVVVLDSLNGFLSAAPSEKYLSIHLHELLSFLGHRGVATIVTVAQTGMLGPMAGPIDVSYLADTVVLLRFFESAGRVRKAISVIKRRTGRHEDAIREFQIRSGGIFVGPPLTEFHGVLTGVPNYFGNPEKMLQRAPERTST